MVPRSGGVRAIGCVGISGALNLVSGQLVSCWQGRVRVISPVGKTRLKQALNLFKQWGIVKATDGADETRQKDIHLG